MCLQLSPGAVRPEVGEKDIGYCTLGGDVHLIQGIFFVKLIDDMTAAIRRLLFQMRIAPSYRDAPAVGGYIVIRTARVLHEYFVKCHQHKARLTFSEFAQCTFRNQIVDDIIRIVSECFSNSVFT